MKSQFYKTVLPSMLAFAFSGVYAIVDGWFIGQNLSDAGLSAINVAYPITALVQAIGTGIGMGAAVLLAMALAQGNKQQEKELMGCSLLMLLLASLFTTIILYFSYPFLLSVLGAKGEIIPLCQQYSRIMILGATIQIFSTGCLPLVRNYQGAVVAMLAMLAGFLTNVILDWYLITYLHQGMSGAAMATLIGQALTLLPCLLFFIKKEKLFGFAKWQGALSHSPQILKIGVSPFGLTLSPNLAIVVLNNGAYQHGAADGVAIYAVVSYVVCVVQLLIQGIADGAQPLMSRTYAMKDIEHERLTCKLAYRFAVAMSGFCMGLLIIGRTFFPILFGVSEHIVHEVAQTLPLFTLGFFFAAFLRVTTSYFYATKKNTCAYLLIYGEPILLTLLVLLGLPNFMGLTGVWLSVPLSQLILAVIAFILLKKYGYQAHHRNTESQRESTMFIGKESS